MLVVPATWEAESSGLHELQDSRSAWTAQGDIILNYYDEGFRQPHLTLKLELGVLPRQQYLEKLLRLCVSN